MNKCLSIVIILSMAIFAWACEQDGMSTNDLELLRQESGDFTLIGSENIYEELQENSSGGFSIDFEITDISRTEENGKSYLRIEIIHQSCNPETRIVWDGRTAQLRGQPPHIFLVVQLLATDECLETDRKSEIFLLDLLDVFDKNIAEQAEFTVQNASLFGNDDSDNDKEIEFPMPWTPHDPSDQ